MKALPKISSAKYQAAPPAALPMGTPEKPVGIPLATAPGAATQARCKTCGPVKIEKP